jgi:hypothetical protein
MVRLEDVTIVASVIGIAKTVPVSVVVKKWHGTNTIRDSRHDN